MPKDKKSKEGKKEGSSGQEVEIVVKRKSSIVDSSGGSSSSSSSDNSGNSSDHSQSGDSDGSIGFVSDNEKGTMTNDSQEGTSSSGVSVNIVDRTDEMIKLVNQHNKEKPVRIVNDKNGIPIKDSTHFVPIDGMPDREDGQSTSANYHKDQQSINKSKSGKGNCKQKQLTKKQRKEQEKKEKEISGIPTNYPGQRERTKRPLEYMVEGEHDAERDHHHQQHHHHHHHHHQHQHQLQPQQQQEPQQQPQPQSQQPQSQQPPQQPPQQPQNDEEQVEGQVHIHHFDDWTGDSVRDGEMVIRGKNAAAQTMLGGQNQVVIPFLRKESELGPPMRFTDLHKNSQKRYLRYTHALGQYIGLEPSIKLIHRMGYGIAASGIPDNQPLTLTINGAKPFMKHNYSEYVQSSGKLTNWRSEFSAHLDMDANVRPKEFEDMQNNLNDSIKRMIDETKDSTMKKNLTILRDKDLRSLLLRYGEMERKISKTEAKSKHRPKTGSGDKNCRYANMKRSDRVSCFSSLTLEAGTQRFLEKFEDNVTEKRACTILMHLASTAPDEKPCYADKHRKCSMLHYMLATSDNREAHMSHKFTGGNTLLHFAAMTGSPCQVDVLLRNGAALNHLNDLFKSPVALATRRHSNLIARQLMWHGADIGGSLSLHHIRPKNARETANKELSDSHDYHASVVRFKAREFFRKRILALTNTFISWVEAILIEADTRLPLGIHSVKSNLHQVRIGRDIMDEMVEVRGSVFVKRFKKTFNMSIEKSNLQNEPIVLFLIPCQYTRYDATMPDHNPHIVRTSMLTDAHAVAHLIATKETERRAKEGNRVEYKDELKNCRPVKVLAEPITISFGDCSVDRNEVLESFFSYEHNGVIYAYNLPKTVTLPLADGLTHSSITVTLTIPENECNRFKDCFFMAQALQVIVREQQMAIFNVGESSPPTSSLNEKPKDPRADLIAEQVAQRRADLVASEIERLKELKSFEKQREEKQREMVSDIKSSVAIRKTNKEAEAAAASTVQEASTSSSASTTVSLSEAERKMSRKTKTD